MQNDRPLTKDELRALDEFADKLFGQIGIDIEFTRHFLDRVNDPRNREQITLGELAKLFKEIYHKWGKPIKQMGPDAEAVMKDLQTKINLPFVLVWDRRAQELDLIAKSVMRKDKFGTSNRVFAVEDSPESVTDPEDMEVYVPGLGTYTVKTLRMSIKTALEDLAARMEKANGADIRTVNFAMESNVIAEKIKALNAAYEELSKNPEYGHVYENSHNNAVTVEDVRKTYEDYVSMHGTNQEEFNDAEYYNKTRGREASRKRFFSGEAGRVMKQIHRMEKVVSDLKSLPSTHNINPTMVDTLLSLLHAASDELKSKTVNEGVETSRDVVSLVESYLTELGIIKPKPSETAGIDRDEMPQIHSGAQQDFFKFIKDTTGVTTSKVTVKASTLSATQGEFKDEKIKKAIDTMTSDQKSEKEIPPIIISSDNFVIDGHHRWLAALNLDTTLDAYRVNTDWKSVIELAKEFPQTTFKDIDNKAVTAESVIAMYRQYTSEEAGGVGKIVKGVNTTKDVGTDAIKKQAAKFGNKVDSGGNPPLLSTSKKKTSPNTLFNLGMTESTKDNKQKLNVESFANTIKAKYDLKDLWLVSLDNRNAIELSSIIVGKDSQKQGTGTKAMEEIVAFAETHGRILVLDPGLLDKKHGTTSQSRLRKFYKRFGFIENKGPNKNYEFKQLMIRYPNNNINESTDVLNNPKFKRWFGKSKVVDEQGNPLEVYHGTKGDFTKFRTPAWFSPSKRHADGFSAEWGMDGRRDENSKVMDVFLRIENPIYTDDWDITEGKAFDAEWRKEQEAAGHDGIIFSDEGEVEYIIFHPNQVKAVVSNSFDDTSDDINEEVEQVSEIKLGGDIDKNWRTSKEITKMASYAKPRRVGKVGGYPVHLKKHSSTIEVFLTDPENNAYVGYLGLELYTGEKSYIAEVAFDPSIQGKGLGAKLYAYVINKLDITIISDTSQTKGSKSLWEQLSKSPGINVYGWNGRDDFFIWDPDEDPDEEIYNSRQARLDILADVEQRSNDLVASAKAGEVDMDTASERIKQINDRASEQISQLVKKPESSMRLIATKNTKATEKSEITKESVTTRYQEFIAESNNVINEIVADTSIGKKYGDVGVLNPMPDLTPTGDKISGLEVYVKSPRYSNDIDTIAVKDGDEVIGALWLHDHGFGKETNIVLKSKYHGKGIAHKMYMYAIEQLGMTLVSDLSQTKGSETIWRKLAKTPGVFVYAWAKKRDKFFQWDPDVDPREEVYFDDATDHYYAEIERLKNDVFRGVQKGEVAYDDGREKVATIDAKYKNNIADLQSVIRDDVALVATTKKGLAENTITEIRDTNVAKAWANVLDLEFEASSAQRTKGKVDGYSVYIDKSEPGSAALYLRNDKEKEFIGVLWLLKNNHDIGDALYSTVAFKEEYQGKGLALKLYTYAIVDLGYTIASDKEQSKGSQIIWKNLASQPNVFVYAWNPITDDYFQWDPEEDDMSYVYAAASSQDFQDLKYHLEMYKNNLQKDANAGKISSEEAMKVFAKKKKEVLAKLDDIIENSPDDIRLVATANNIDTKKIDENMSITGTETARDAKRKGIEPGTEAWFKHWFSLPYMIPKSRSESHAKKTTRRRTGRGNGSDE